MSEAIRKPREIDLFHVESHRLFDVWGRVFPHVRDACDDTITPAEILSWLSNGKASLWVMVDDDGNVEASCVHRVCEAKGRRYLDVVTLGGSGFRRWAPALQKALEAAVNDNGCEGMSCSTVRPGMEKWLGELGWRRHRVEMRWPNGR